MPNELMGKLGFDFGFVDSRFDHFRSSAEAAFRESASGFTRCTDFDAGMADNAVQMLAFWLQQNKRPTEAEKVLKQMGAL